MGTVQEKIQEALVGHMATREVWNLVIAEADLVVRYSISKYLQKKMLLPRGTLWCVFSSWGFVGKPSEQSASFLLWC